MHVGMVITYFCYHFMRLYRNNANMTNYGLIAYNCIFLWQACLRNVIYSSYPVQPNGLDANDGKNFDKFSNNSLERIESLNKLLKQLDFISNEKYRKEIKYMCAMSIILYCDQYKKIDYFHSLPSGDEINILHQFLPFLESSGIKEYLKFFKNHQLAIRQIAHNHSDVTIFDWNEVLAGFADSQEDSNKIKKHI
jgi:hypothetical protein